MAIQRPRHPNRAAFRGVLTLVDTPSDRPPAGARGHRVLLTRAAAQAALPSLLGMGLGYTPALDGHDARRKVGIITAAEIAGRELRVSGYIFGRDFPELLRELRAGRPLGMSYELVDARVEDARAALWVLSEVTFTGAAVLRREKAAYGNTSIELEAASFAPDFSAARYAAPAPAPLSAATADIPTGAPMNQELTQQLAAAVERLAAAGHALEKAFQENVTHIHAQQEALHAKVDRIIATIDDAAPEAGAARALQARVEELERANQELKAQAGRAAEVAARKTLPPLVSALLAKSGVEADGHIDAATLDKTLASLSVEQRIAVKAQMARAGIIG